MHEGRIEYQKLIAERIRGARVIDIGCVAMKAVNYLYAHDVYAASAESIIGVDIAKDLIDKLRRENIFALDVEDEIACAAFSAGHGRFTHVIATELIEHLDNPGMALKGIEQLIEPGGWLHIATPNALTPLLLYEELLHDKRTGYPLHPDHVHWYCRKSLKHLLERAGGWSVVSTTFHKDPVDVNAAEKLNIPWHDWMGGHVYVEAQRHEKLP